MSLKNQFKIFNNLPLQSKLIIYVSGFAFLSLLSLFIASLYNERIVLFWVSIVIFSLCILLYFLIAKSTSLHIQTISRIVNAYAKGDFEFLDKQKHDEQYNQIINSLNKLSQSYQSDFEEKISDENLAMMGEFATFIIHDLKNPISGIHLLAEGLNKKVKEDDDLKKYANEILLASQKLDDFINKTLDISKSMIMHRKMIDLNNLIDDVVHEINLEGIQLQKKYDDSISEIFIDYQLIFRAVSNLIINAAESIQSNGNIFIETHKGENIIIRIADNGTGIDPEKLKTIFRPFYSSKGQGHGLGLAMAKKAVLMHHGSIDVKSSPGKGTVFTIMLPLIIKDNNSFQNDMRKE